VKCNIYRGKDAEEKGWKEIRRKRFSVHHIGQERKCLDGIGEES